MLQLDLDFYLHAPFEAELPNWTVRGLISRNEYIQLTPDEPLSFGYVTSKNPISASSWRVDFEFHISASRGEFVGDGLAFWYTRNPIFPGIALGASDVFEGLGIFIDTHPNAPSIKINFPQVFYMLSDGAQKYNQSTDGQPHAIPACHPSVKIINSENPIGVSVSYENTLLRMSIGGEQCFSIKSKQLDFDGHLSISAGTGAAHSSHRLVSLEASTSHRQEKSPHDEDLHVNLYFCILVCSTIAMLFFKFIKMRF